MVKQERAARTRETLIRSAAEVFGREGFSRASLTAICARAGVSAGALHFHFESKAALADVVEAEALSRLLAVIRTAFPAPSHVQLLVDTTHRLADALCSDVVLRTGFSLGSELSHPAGTDLRDHWRCWVEQELVQAEAKGELRPGVAAQDVVAIVVAATVGLEVLGARDAKWLSIGTVSRIWRLLLPSVAPGPLLAQLEAGGTRPR
ncbi:ScbR family autoregulator-binding transcription factor [Streptomyces soliscabiei]|uniref:ScbR family autoregulator-binding transcription factor n=1 Tax=Streptomyces soliscabiei TaxID=588897 RepID=UPI0029AAB328|nr:ScbR family autoregulator-binding transcription factor [Streptomyces sp. NY05-11A]MDX2680436.1 ScbR family autoregulator-binding transcription factor [Streptomyces sp. NY05-11A]